MTSTTGKQPFEIIGIEVTQGLQENIFAATRAGQNSLPLLAGKRTLARVYIARTTPAKRADTLSAEGYLKVVLHNGGKPVERQVHSIGRRLLINGERARETDLRSNLERTLNFEFDLLELFGNSKASEAGMLKRDCITVSLGVDWVRIDEHDVVDQGAYTDPPARDENGDNEKLQLELEFRPGGTLKLHMLGLRYLDDAGEVYFPAREHFDNIANSIANLYPIDACAASHVVVDAIPEFTLPFAEADGAEPDWEWYYKVSLAHAQLLAHRTLDLDANQDFTAAQAGDKDRRSQYTSRLLETWYYAVVDYPDDDFFRGAASGIQDAGETSDKAAEGSISGVNANFDYVACGPVEDAGGLYAAHEIAHCLELHHPGIGDQYRIEPHYPFAGGYISADRYPDAGSPDIVKLFEDPTRINRGNIDELIEESHTHAGLINNRTLRRLIERFRRRDYQGANNRDDCIAGFGSDLQEWRDEARRYGVEHQGLSWHNWKTGRALLGHSEHYDFMGYLEPKWISPFSYRKLETHIASFREARYYNRGLEPDGDIAPGDEVGANDENGHGTPPNICIIGLHNELLGSGVIKYLFRTHEAPTCNKETENCGDREETGGGEVPAKQKAPAGKSNSKSNTGTADDENPDPPIRSIRLRFDDCPVDPVYIRHKDRLENKLGDPVFLKAGIFKCVIADTGWNRDQPDKKASACTELGLDVLVDISAGARQNGASSASEPIYLNVDRVPLKEKDAGSEQGARPQPRRLCNCKNQPFEIVRSSPEDLEADYFLKLTGNESSDCSYVARARFFDRRGFERNREKGITNWMTLGVNFRSSHYLYLDRDHCLLPGSQVLEIEDLIIPKETVLEAQQQESDSRLPSGETEGDAGGDRHYLQPFVKIREFYEEIERREAPAPDLFAFALELVCLSALDYTPIFKGLIIERPDDPGKFYYINSGEKVCKPVEDRIGYLP